MEPSGISMSVNDVEGMRRRGDAITARGVDADPSVMLRHLASERKEGAMRVAHAQVVVCAANSDAQPPAVCLERAAHHTPSTVDEDAPAREEHRKRRESLDRRTPVQCDVVRVLLHARKVLRERQVRKYRVRNV